VRNNKEHITENELSKIIVNIAYQIHTKIGPGLMESVYEEIMFQEHKSFGLKVKR
jgi:GxxExxY protein